GWEIAGGHMPTGRLAGRTIGVLSPGRSRSVQGSGFSDRVAGVLVGGAAGDALGAGYEFTRPGPDAEIGMIGGGPFDWAPGEWTDDTSMALAVALASVHGPGLDLDAVAAGFVAWFDSEPPDIGNQTHQVLSARSPSAL